jgi:hypothetical protein
MIVASCKDLREIRIAFENLEHAKRAFECLDQ